MIPFLLLYIFNMNTGTVVTLGSVNELRVVKSGTTYTYFYNTGAGFHQIATVTFTAPIFLAGPCILTFYILFPLLFFL